MVEQEMEMPANYTEMDVQETQYDGAFSWKTFGIVVGVIAALAIGGSILYATLGRTQVATTATRVGGTGLDEGFFMEGSVLLRRRMPRPIRRMYRALRGGYGLPVAPTGSQCT